MLPASVLLATSLLVTNPEQVCAMLSGHTCTVEYKSASQGSESPGKAHVNYKILSDFRSCRLSDFLNKCATVYPDSSGQQCLIDPKRSGQRPVPKK
jgi:hypothetical protein